MRHQVYGRHLGRTSAHRTALKRNLTASLIEHGTIATTPQKAKFVKPFAEKMITLAKQGTLHARRRAISQLQNRDICKDENGDSVKVSTVIDRLFDEIAPRFSQRNGGYTRIIKLPLRRIGDNGQLVFLQLVEEKTSSSDAQRAVTVEQSAAPAVDAPAAPTETVDSPEPQDVQADKQSEPETQEQDEQESKKEAD